MVLTTPRLLLRTYRADDLPLFAELNRDPQVMEFLEGRPLTRAESDGIAAWAQEHFRLERMGLLAIERRADGTFLGMCGLHRQHWYPDDVEIGWRLARAYWGHGYATEAATAWLDHGFEDLRLERVISITDVPNRRSRAVMERLGMVLDHEAELEDDGVRFDAVIYAITAEGWRGRTRSG